MTSNFDRAMMRLDAEDHFSDLFADRETDLPFDPDACEVVAYTDEIERAEWLELRRTGIGGSDAAAAMGLSPFMSRLALYYDKTDPRPDEDKEIFKWGRRLEDPIAKAFAEETGLTVTHLPVMLRSKRWNFMLANPDRWVWDGDTWSILECKNVNATKAHEWADGPPLHYRIQGQQYLAVTGLGCVYFAVLLGGNKLVVFEVLRDDDLIAAMVAQEEAFWTLVQMRREPEPDGSESSSIALRSLHMQEEPGKVVEGGAALEQLLRRRAAAKAVLERAQYEAREVDNLIIALLGDAETGTVDGRVAVTWKTQTRKSYTVEESSSRVLRVKRENQ